MGAAKGRPKPPGSGRQKGAHNKKTEQLLEQLKQLGVDLPREAVEALREIDDPKDRFDCIEKLMRYVYPQKKSVDHVMTDSDGQGFKILVEDYSKT